jgi:hypothetical protein
MTVRKSATESIALPGVPFAQFDDVVHVPDASTFHVGGRLMIDWRFVKYFPTRFA